MENQKYSYINAYVLGKDNARTFVEFTLKVKNEIESGFKSGTEYFYIVDKNNKENNMKLKKLPIGTILVIILNNYNRIKKVLENHKNMIYNAEKESTCDVVCGNTSIERSGKFSDADGGGKAWQLECDSSDVSGVK